MTSWALDTNYCTSKLREEGSREMMAESDNGWVLVVHWAENTNYTNYGWVVYDGVDRTSNVLLC